jgi:hypothetical protein
MSNSGCIVEAGAAARVLTSSIYANELGPHVGPQPPRHPGCEGGGGAALSAAQEKVQIEAQPALATRHPQAPETQAKKKRKRLAHSKTRLPRHSRLPKPPSLFPSPSAAAPARRCTAPALPARADMSNKQSKRVKGKKISRPFCEHPISQHPLVHH